MIRRTLSYMARPGLGQQLVKAVIGSAGLRIVGMGFGFLVGVQLARGLGPAGYGVYGTAMAIISVLMIPTELGLPQLVMREVAAALALDGLGATTAVVKWGRRIVALSSVTIAAVTFCVLATGFLDISMAVRSALLIGLLWIPVVAIGNIYGAALRGMHWIVSGQIGEFIVRPALVSLFLFLLVSQGAWLLNPTSAMGANVLGASVAAGLSIFLLRKAGAGPASVGAIQGLRFSHAIPMAMSEGMRVLGAQVSMLVLAAMASKEHVGLYRVAYGIYTVTTMPSALINVACAPAIASLNVQRKNRELARLNVWISIFLVSAAALFVFLDYFFGRIAVSALFGQAYAEAGSLLMIFLCGELVASLFGHPTIVLNMMRHQRVVMWWSAVALAVNLLLAVSLVHSIGYTGAAYASATGLVIWRLGCAVFAKRRLGMDTAFATKLIPVAHIR